MEGESIPPHSEMEAGNMNPEAVPVKSLVGYGDEGPDGHHQNDQAEMDQVRYLNPYNTHLNAYLLLSN